MSRDEFEDEFQGDPEDIDTGEPIYELTTLEELPRPGFFDRIRNSVERRRLGADVGTFSIGALGALVWEYLGAFLEAIMGSRERRDR